MQFNALGGISDRLHCPIKERWRGVGSQQIGEQELLVQDPGGYLLGFSQYQGDLDAEP